MRSTQRTTPGWHAPLSALMPMSAAIEDADPGPRRIAAVLDGIPDAYERAQGNLERARAGATTARDEL